MYVRHVTETDNVHTQVTQHEYTSNTTYKQWKQTEFTENNQNCKTLRLFIRLSAETWITFMKMTENASNSFSRNNEKSARFPKKMPKKMLA